MGKANFENWLKQQFKIKTIDIAGSYLDEYIAFVEFQESKSGLGDPSTKINALQEWIDNDPDFKKIVFDIHDMQKDMLQILDQWSKADETIKKRIEEKAKKDFTDRKALIPHENCVKEGSKIHGLIQKLAESAKKKPNKPEPDESLKCIGTGFVQNMCSKFEGSKLTSWQHQKQRAQNRKWKMNGGINRYLRRPRLD